MTTIEPKIFDLSELQQLCAQSIELSYNVNAADTLSLTLKPEAYKELAFHRGERVVLYEGERKVFSGYVHEEPARSIQAGAGEVVSVSAASDWSILERTVWAKQNNNKVFVYPSGGKPGIFVNLEEHVNEVLTWAKGWKGARLESSLSASGAVGSVEVPKPEMSGICSCADIVADALAWAPNVGVVQRYGAADSLCLTSAENEGELTFEAQALLTSVNLARKSVPPVFALVGGDHYVLPAGADVREMNAFVFAVPLASDGVNAPAGGAAASQRGEIKGVAVPSRCYVTRTREEYIHEPLADKRTERWIRRFFPQYEPFLEHCMTGAAVATVVSKEDMKADAEEDAEEGEKVEVPANYSDTPQNWAGAGDSDFDISNGVYVLTDGSFAASADEQKNLRGLKWCKARIEMQITIPLAAVRGMDVHLRDLATELFPAKFRLRNKDKVYETRRHGKLVLECILVNARKRLFDPATNKPFPSDSSWQEEDGEEPTREEYRRALRLFAAGNKEHFEGEVEFLLEADEIQPEVLCMRGVRILGKNEEWARGEMQVRGVQWSYGDRKVSLSIGMPDVQGFDSVLQRLVMQRASRNANSQRLVLPYDTEDEEAREENEASLTVSPSVSASVAAVTSGRARKPWTLYEYVDEDGKATVWLTGGTLFKNGESFIVPDSDRQIDRGEPTDELWVWGEKVKLKWQNTEDGRLTYKIYQTV